MVYVWVGWGGGNNVHVNLNTHGLYDVHMGVGLGWGGVGVKTFMSTGKMHATLWDLLLHLRAYVMLRCGIFSCTCTRTSCYAVGSSLALAHNTSCYAVRSSLALARIRHATLCYLLLHFAHIRHAMLWDLLFHLHTYIMLRCAIFFCTCTHTSCYAAGSSIALAYLRHATLCYLFCTCIPTSCYAAGSSIALAYLRHATLCYLFCTCIPTSCYAVLSFLHLHTYVMLRCAIFFRPGLFLAPALCLVVSNFDLNLLISTAALELQLSKRCPTWPHPRHVRGIRSLTLSMLHSCKQSKVYST